MECYQGSGTWDSLWLECAVSPSLPTSQWCYLEELAEPLADGPRWWWGSPAGSQPTLFLAPGIWFPSVLGNVSWCLVRPPTELGLFPPSCLLCHNGLHRLNRKLLFCFPAVCHSDKTSSNTGGLEQRAGALARQSHSLHTKFSLSSSDDRKGGPGQLLTPPLPQVIPRLAKDHW